MVASIWLIDLKKKLPEKDWATLVAALRLDAICWKTLAEPGFQQRALATLAERLDDWSPATLALLAGHEGLPVAALKASPITALPESLRIYSESKLGEWLTGTLKNPTLAEAGSLALGLREQFVQNGAWEGLAGKIGLTQPGAQTILACLFGMLPQPQELFRYLLSLDLPDGQREVCLRAFLSHPMGKEDTLVALVAVVNTLPASTTWKLMAALHRLRPDLSGQVAEQILPGMDWRTAAPPQPAVQELVGKVALADFDHYAHNPRQIDRLIDALAYTRRLAGWLAGELAEAAGQQAGDIQPAGRSALGNAIDPASSPLEAWKLAMRAAPFEPLSLAGGVNYLIETKSLTDAEAWLLAYGGDLEHPAIQLQIARLRDQQSRPGEALAAAEKAINCRDQITGEERSRFTLQLADLFEANGRPDQSEALLAATLENDPLQPELHMALARLKVALLQRESDDYPVFTEQLALVEAATAFGLRLLAEDETDLVKSKPEFVRTFAEALEINAEWSLAYHARSLLVSEAASTAELLRYANTALAAGELAAASKTLHQALTSEPENGEACLLGGKILASQGNMPGAIQLYQEAARNSPGLVPAWLSLVEAFQNTSQPERAHEILRAAALANPESVEVLLALGENCLDRQAPTEAIAPLGKAAGLVETQAGSKGTRGYLVKTARPSFSYAQNPNLAASQVFFRLGQAMQATGRNNESLAAYTSAMVSALGGVEDNLALFQGYGQALLTAKEWEIAIPILETLLEAQYGKTDTEKLLGLQLDLAQAYLMVNEQPAGADQAEPLLLAIQSQARDPQLVHQAQALLGEAQNLQGKSLEAQNNILKALTSPLARSPSWHARLAFGYGKASYSLNKPEVALAAFQESTQFEPDNVEIQRWLSEAYLATHLLHDGFAAAQRYLQLHGLDHDTVAWFADQCVRIFKDSSFTPLPVLAEAIRSLLKMLQNQPDSPDLWLRLGKIHLLENEKEAAGAAFDQLIRIPPTPGLAGWQNASLHLEAGKALLGAGEALPATGLLHSAASWIQQTHPSSQDQIRMQNQAQPKGLCGFPTPAPLPFVPAVEEAFSNLALAYEKINQLDAAQDTLQEWIQLEPDQPQAYIRLADSLLLRGQWEDAIGCLEKALDLQPDQVNLYDRICGIYSQAGKLELALTTAEKAYQSLNDAEAMYRLAEETEASPTEISFRLLAAELARSQLNLQRAFQAIALGENQNTSFDLLCLKLEVALETGEAADVEFNLGANYSPEAGLTRQMNQVEQMNPQHPRRLALTARLQSILAKSDLVNGGKWSGCDPAMIAFCLEAITKAANERLRWNALASLRGVAEGLLATGEYQSAIEAFEHLCQATPYEPYAYLELARALTVRAEHQQTCTALGILPETLDEDAVSGAAFNRFLTSVEKSLRRLSDLMEHEPMADASNQDDISPQNSIIYWRERGMLVFQPNPINLESFQQVSRIENDILPLALAYRNLNDVEGASRLAERVTKVNSDKKTAKLFLLQALALEFTRPWEALEAICQSIETATDEKGKDENAQALRLAVLARLSYRTGGQNRLGLEAEVSIENALRLRPDEPHWHALAAEILAGNPNPSAEKRNKALEHMEAAITLEPENPLHYYALGRLYLTNGETVLAKEAFSKSCSLAPNSAEPWLALARAQFQDNELNLAITSADRAIEHAIDPLQALLLRGEIALLTGNPRSALSKAQAALRLYPDNLDALQLMARSLNGLNRSEEALRIMNRVIPLVEKPLPLELERSEWLCKTAPPQEASLELRSLVNRYPHEPKFKYLLSQALAKSGQTEAALLAARQALQDSDLGLAGEEQSRLNLLIGQVYRTSGQLDSAIFHLIQAVDLCPTNLEAHLELGQAHQERRQHNQACKVFQGAIHVAPKDFRPYYLAGLSYKEIKDYQTSEEMLERAAELAPHDTAVHRQLGAVVALNLVHNRQHVSYPAKTR